MTIYLGTQGWSYRDWVGPFYPPRSSPGDYLRLYASTFGAVELDTTFYGIPSRDRVRAWATATPPDFQFTAKVPRSITHDAHLVGADEEMRAFIEVMADLGPKLGAMLIQLPPDFTWSERAGLERFAASLPRDHRFAVEFRHRSWLRSETFDLLRRHGLAWTIIDLASMPQHVEVTANLAYVRWLGNRSAVQRVHAVQIDRKTALDRWAEQLDEVSRRVERLYGFVNNHYSGHSPADVRYLQGKLGLAPRSEPDLEQGTLL